MSAWLPGEGELAVMAGDFSTVALSASHLLRQKRPIRSCKTPLKFIFRRILLRRRLKTAAFPFAVEPNVWDDKTVPEENIALGRFVQGEPAWHSRHDVNQPVEL